MACAAALGTLGYRDAVSDILDCLDKAQGESVRSELTLAVAGIVGGEKQFITLWRKAAREMGTTLSLAIDSVSKWARKLDIDGEQVKALLNACSESLATDDLLAGSRHLIDVIERVGVEKFSPGCTAVLQWCSRRLASDDPLRTECLLLAVHCLRHGLEELKKAADRQNKHR